MEFLARLSQRLVRGKFSLLPGPWWKGSASGSRGGWGWQDTKREGMSRETCNATEPTEEENRLMRGKILPKERQQLKEPFECDGSPCASSNTCFKSTQLLFKLAKDPVMKYTERACLGAKGNQCRRRKSTSKSRSENLGLPFGEVCWSFE